jgi:hypothetical protein
MRAVLALALAIALSACEHSEPFAVRAPGVLGPAGSTLPLQLTFNVGPDQMPAVTPESIVYSTLDPDRADGDRCFGYVPLSGGTRFRTTCIGGPFADDRQDALLQPAPAPDGRIAFVRARDPVGSRSVGGQRLQVAHPDDIENPQLDLSILFTLPDGRRLLGVRELQWTAAGVLRFVAGHEFLDTSDGVDTVFVPLALATVDPDVGTFRQVGGSDDAFTHAEAPGGAIWFLRTDDPHHLRLLEPATGVVSAVGSFAAAVTTIGVVDGQPVGVANGTVDGSPRATLEWLDPITGATTGSLIVSGRVRAVVGVPNSRRVVLEVERSASRDLWLFELP